MFVSITIYMIETWNSEKPCNPIAPNWSFNFWNKGIFSEDQCTAIKNTILGKEVDIIKSNPTVNNDGGTGLGPNSLTSRFSAFNIFTWDNEFVSILKSSVNEAVCELLKNKQFSTKVYGQCWANIMRTGEQIHPHWHSSYKHSFFGGHVCISTQYTHTYYQNPYNKNDAKAFLNLNGNLTVFENYLVHWTDRVETVEPRITLAFDLLTEQAVEESIEDTKNFVELFTV